MGGRGSRGRCLWDPLPSPSSVLCPPPRRAPDRAPARTPFSSGVHVLDPHLNTHSRTICLGLSEDQWGSQGLAQQGAGGKSLTRAKKGTPGVGEAVGRSQAGNTDCEPGAGTLQGQAPRKAWLPGWGDPLDSLLQGVPGRLPGLFCLLTLGTWPFLAPSLRSLIRGHNGIASRLDIRF